MRRESVFGLSDFAGDADHGIPGEFFEDVACYATVHPQMIRHFNKCQLIFFMTLPYNSPNLF